MDRVKTDCVGQMETVTWAWFPKKIMPATLAVRASNTDRAAGPAALHAWTDIGLADAMIQLKGSTMSGHQHNDSNPAGRRNFIATGAAGAVAVVLGGDAAAASAARGTPATRIVAEFLHNTAPDKIEAATARLVAQDATYISLNFDNPELKKVLPWTGTQQGRQAYLTTFAGVAKLWTIEDFKILDLFGAGDNVAVFGSFTYRSNARGKSFTSPFSVHAKVRNGKIVYFLFMEDTFASARSFSSGGTWTIKTDPDGPEFQV